jgi:DNA/RNA-binding domain of Phe-tRNA-synthetase-like protein
VVEASGAFPPPVTIELSGWELLWAELVPTGVGTEELAALRRSLALQAREKLRLETLSEHPAVAGLRRLFRRAGCDPTRYRSGSEALVRRLLKGEELPAVLPLVDLGNCVAADLVTNVCVMDADKTAPPFVFRAGRPGETMLSLRGPFDCAGKPLLLDIVGPADVPITGADRVRVDASTTRAWLIVYLPVPAVSVGQADEALRRVLAAAPVARLAAAGATRQPPGTD